MAEVTPRPGPQAELPPVRGWWRTNRVWLATLLPLVILALLATSFRLQRIYLPWHWTRPQVATGTSLRFVQDWSSEGNTFHREVELKVNTMTVVPRLDGQVAVPGGVLYRIELSASAAPAVMLDGCEVWAEGPDGTLYASGGAGKSSDGSSGYVPWSVACVPADAPGPMLDLDGKTVRPSKAERPATWTIVAGVVLPEGVRPTAIRIGWRTPDYAVFSVPG